MSQDGETRKVTQSTTIEIVEGKLTPEDQEWLDRVGVAKTQGQHDATGDITKFRII